MNMEDVKMEELSSNTAGAAEEPSSVGVSHPAGSADAPSASRPVGSVDDTITGPSSAPAVPMAGGAASKPRCKWLK